MRKLYGLTILIAVLVLFGAEAAQAGKQAICHFPPGNPANFHTIVVSDNAVAKHVEKHDDLVGSCLENCEIICDDGDFCTQDVEADPDQCICLAEPRPPVDCDDSNDCTADSCDSGIGACLNNAEILDGEACDDGDPGTTGEVCSGGECVVPGGLVVNEIDYDQAGSDVAEFVEILSAGSAVDLTGIDLVAINGFTDSIYRTIPLPSVTLSAGDYFVVCGIAANVPNCDLELGGSNLFQNGGSLPDGVALVLDGTVLDTVSYEGDLAAPWTEGSGVGLEDPPTGEGSISRCPDGNDTDQNNVDFAFSPISPGVANICL